VRARRSGVAARAAALHRPDPAAWKTALVELMHGAGRSGAAPKCGTRHALAAQVWQALADRTLTDLWVRVEGALDEREQHRRRGSRHLSEDSQRQRASPHRRRRGGAAARALALPDPADRRGHATTRAAALPLVEPARRPTRGRRSATVDVLLRAGSRR